MANTYSLKLSSNASLSTKSPPSSVEASQRVILTALKLTADLGLYLYSFHFDLRPAAYT